MLESAVLMLGNGILKELCLEKLSALNLSISNGAITLDISLIRTLCTIPFWLKHMHTAAPYSSR